MGIARIAVHFSQLISLHQNILAVAEAADENDKAALQRLAGDDYSAEISAKRVSILDLLDRYPAVNLPFSIFLTLLPPMRVRQ